MQKLLHIFCVAFIVLLSQCGGGEGGNQGPEEIGLVNFENQSQFAIEALYIHDAVDNYKGQTNRIESPLLPGKQIQANIPLRAWYVTVFRKPNKDSPVLAYTTAKAWSAKTYRRLIYFDEQYREHIR